MKRMMDCGWVQKRPNITPEIEFAYLADEIIRLKEDLKLCEFRARLLNEHQKRMYKGKSNLDAQYYN